MGYDNQKKHYESVWMDNMGTMIMTGEGTCDNQGKTLTFTSRFTDPMSGQVVVMKSVYRIESNDKYLLQMYMPGPDGKEFLNMEIAHTRAK